MFFSSKYEIIRPPAHQKFCLGLCRILRNVGDAIISKIRSINNLKIVYIHIKLGDRTVDLQSSD